MWSDHVFTCVFHWRSVCREKDGEKKLESEDKYQVTCVTERCFYMSLIGK